MKTKEGDLLSAIHKCVDQLDQVIREMHPPRQVLCHRFHSLWALLPRHSGDCRSSSSRRQGHWSAGSCHRCWTRSATTTRYQWAHIPPCMYLCGPSHWCRRCQHLLDRTRFHLRRPLALCHQMTTSHIPSIGGITTIVDYVGITDARGFASVHAQTLPATCATSGLAHIHSPSSPSSSSSSLTSSLHASSRNSFPICLFWGVSSSTYHYLWVVYCDTSLKYLNIHKTHM